MGCFLSQTERCHLQKTDAADPLKFFIANGKHDNGRCFLSQTSPSFSARGPHQLLSSRWEGGENINKVQIQRNKNRGVNFSHLSNMIIFSSYLV